MKTFTDPVCGMLVREGTGFSVAYQGEQYHFCSEFCQRSFQAEPEKYCPRPHVGGTVDADTSQRIAYFSMEVAVASRMPNYSGGLGVLAGDTLKSCADLKVPAVAVSLMYRNGYFQQCLDAWGNQQEYPVAWEPLRFARLLPVRVTVAIEGRPVVVRAWQYDITGVTGYCVPLLLLDTNTEENTPEDRELCAWLYGGDDRYRLAQEVILGIGGVRMLRALGYTALERFHMNEGHAALLVVELLRESRNPPNAAFDFEAVRKRCVFTTHTPVPAGHDQFSYDLFTRVAGGLIPLEVVQMLSGPERLDMTLVALNTSHYVNGVAKRHGEVSRTMFAGYAIDWVTNGVHSRTWTCASFRSLYDRHMPGWANDPFALRYAIGIPGDEIWKAHAKAKTRLIEEAVRRTGKPFKTDVFTIGFARRATAYKRADLLFHDPSQLLDISRNVGPIQVLFAGKAHPKDFGGKELIRRIFAVAAQLKDQVTIAYLENYDMDLALLLTAGVDLWLNTPLRPLEASGTSGMKAAHNGVPSLSVLDGWWIEGHIEGVTGWSIGCREPEVDSPDSASRNDADDLYRKLRSEVLPAYYANRERWIGVMRQAIAFNASFFNTHRMVQQYTTNAYV
jgi:starch phosphorylase